MTTQTEAQVEEKFLNQLAGQGFERVMLVDASGMLDNLRLQLEAFNGLTFSDREFTSVLNHLGKGGTFDKAETLRDRFQLTREGGESVWIQFFETDNPARNRWQVTNQVEQSGAFLNRYDVTVLANGLPVVHIELKRAGIELKEAFNQVGRYQRHSFWTNHGLYNFTQVFVISNRENTKYFANQRGDSFKQTTFWANEQNQKITDLTEFASTFLTPAHLTKLIGQYIVLNTARKLMVMRPYQIYATEAIVEQVKRGNGNGYIWHTTGSGKTLTSFKAAQIVTAMPEVAKVVFVVDRKDLDYQTIKEFDSFQKGSVEATSGASSLAKQLLGEARLIVTTIQKLNNVVSKSTYHQRLAGMRNERMVFIFDECHRSQFGATHKRIIEFFPNHQLFGFTGTPIFAVNASRNELGKRTTRDLFGGCLHKYVITDAIRDHKVLPFAVEYVGRYRNTSRNFVDIQVEDIDSAEVHASPDRMEKIVDYIIAHHGTKTYNREFNSIFAVSSIKQLIAYYGIFQKKRLEGQHDLRLAAIFTFEANEEDAQAQDIEVESEFGLAAEEDISWNSLHSRDALENIMADYNRDFGVSYTTRTTDGFDSYFKDIGKRMKSQAELPAAERVDVLLVVSMFLTGFDARKLNTLYVDKNLQHHGLIQAFSRTNRVQGDKKAFGNILCFRNLKQRTDDAITLYSNKEALEVVIVPPFERQMEKLEVAIGELLQLVPSPSDVDRLESELQEHAFVVSFRSVLRAHNSAVSFADFSWEDCALDEETFNAFKTKYLDLRDAVAARLRKEKVSILEEIDFEVELVHRDRIDVTYILGLIGSAHVSASPSQAENARKRALQYLRTEPSLRSKRELIEKFINEQLPVLASDADVHDAFDAYVQEEKLKALDRICEEEKLKHSDFAALINSYVFSKQLPIWKDVLGCLSSPPSILERKVVAERILEKMREYVEVYVETMVA
jgi:type I restriction enzyme R subunit